MLSKEFFNNLWSHLVQSLSKLVGYSPRLFFPIKGRLYWWEITNMFVQALPYSLTNWNEISKKYLFCLLASVSGVYSQSALWQDTDQLLVLGCNTQAKHAPKLWWLKYSAVLILDSCATPLGPNLSAVFSQKCDHLTLLFQSWQLKPP